MSKFECPVVRIREVKDHPNADRLTLNYIGDFICISNRKEDGSARYAAGDLVVYIPEGSIIPEWLLRRLDMWKEDFDPETGIDNGKGILNGPRGNRVKAMKLRGIMSQGVIMPVVEHHFRHGMGFVGNGLYSLHRDPDVPAAVESDLDGGYWYAVTEGEDVSAYLGVVKYEPPVPTHMAGQVVNIHGRTLKWDVENLKKFPDMFEEGVEQVIATEKYHGTCCQFGIIPGLGLDFPELPEDWFVGSKGLSAEGLVFKDNEENAGNLYLRVVKKMDIPAKVRAYFSETINAGNSVYVFGEIMGPGVQKGFDYGLKEPGFAGFAIAIKSFDGSVAWCEPSALKGVFDALGLPMVNILYQGPFRRELMDTYRDGTTTVNGGKHIREGIVITSAVGARDPRIGLKMLKHVSEAYLNKSTGEEFA